MLMLSDRCLVCDISVGKIGTERGREKGGRRILAAGLPWSLSGVPFSPSVEYFMADCGQSLATTTVRYGPKRSNSLWIILGR